MARLRTKSLVRQNLKLWLDDLLLRDGFYTTVALDDTDEYGNNISELILTDNPHYPVGSTYQSAFKNWVYESGIIPTESGLVAPIVASGVYVDGTFYAQDTTSPDYNASYHHFIDYENGRVVFVSGIASSSVVKGNFSYKEVFVDYADSLNNEQRPLHIETAYKDNPWMTGIDIYPEARSRTLPAIFIDIRDRTSTGYELGWKSLISELRGFFHVWSHDNYFADMVEDLLTDTQHDVILGINFNTAPDPLGAMGEKNGAYTSYGDLAQVWAPHFWRRIYLDNISATKDDSLFEIEKTRISFTARVYPNF